MNLTLFPIRDRPARTIGIWAPTQPICGTAGYVMVMGQILYRKSV
jgi:hypothetical protein